jgi:cell division protein FtsL
VFFLILLVGQFLFYGIGVYSLFSKSLIGVLKIPMFFLVVNTAIAVAWWQYLTGKRVVFWEPSVR